MPTVFVTDILKLLAKLARNHVAEEPQLAPSCHRRPWNMTKTVPPDKACGHRVDQKTHTSDDQGCATKQCHGSLLFRPWVLIKLNRWLSISMSLRIVELRDNHANLALLDGQRQGPAIIIISERADRWVNAVRSCNWVAIQISGYYTYTSRNRSAALFL